ncbi:MAG: ABC transporter substrate-binding protein, partial [Chloroflexi bacterium]|nr:ABC transporter substrate-binding protein [Chloroflexota bacterium]
PAQQPAAAPAGAAFRAAIGVDPDTLEPAGQTTTTVQNIVDYVTEPLVLLQPDGKLAPGLAEKWEPSADGKTYTFTLRKGVKFHDDSDLDAETVKLSLERILNPQMKVAVRDPFTRDRVEAVTAVDPGTVRIQLKDPFGPFLSKMAGTEMSIVSKATSQKFPDSYNEEPVGTGPYRLKERRKGESVSLERNEAYWGQKPYYGSVVFRIVPEAATRESLLLANQVDMIILPPISDIPALQRNNNVKVLLAESNRTIFLAMDQTLPGGTPLADKRVRQALNYAVDKEGIIKSVLFGAATAMDAPMSPSLFGHAKQTPYAYDPNKAKQLLQEAGQPSLSLKFIHPTGRYVQDAQGAQAIAGNLRDVGVTTELATSDWPTYLASINVPEDKGTAHLHLLGWAPGFLDAFQQMVVFTKTSWPPKGLATAHWTHPRVEELLDQAAKDPSQDKRKELYAEAQMIVWDEAPWIFLWVQNFPIVHSAKVKNISSVPVEKFYAVYAEPA